MDRVNISFAALQMNQDLHFSATVYGLGAGLFFLSYAALEAPSNRATDLSMAKGWLIGVMVELADEPAPVRHFFAVGIDDRANAEWKAIDGALKLGSVAASPVGGLEPVHALGELSARSIDNQGLRPGEVRALGPRTPRLWATVDRPMQG